MAGGAYELPGSEPVAGTKQSNTTPLDSGGTVDATARQSRKIPLVCAFRSHAAGTSAHSRIVMRSRVVVPVALKWTGLCE